MVESAPEEYGYQEKLIAFIDILGFSEIIRSRGQEAIEAIYNGITKNISAYCDFLRKEGDISHDIMGYEIKKINPEYHMFSDTIILYMNDEANNILRFLYVIKLLQKRFIQNGFFIRGAVVKGEIFAKDGVVFGPGIIKAYKLESKAAIYPRIVLDNYIVKKLKGRDNEVKNKNNALLLNAMGGNLLKDNNKIPFLDYLIDSAFLNPSPIVSPLKTKHRKSIKNFLLIHKKAILEQLQASEIMRKDEGVKVRSKYLLLSEYHDFIVNKYFKDAKAELSVGVGLARKPSFQRPF